jgi:DNA invertase Pin-like site-specific DNA recombinase
VLDVADLDRVGVLVVSVKDSWLDTTSGMVRQILVGIFSAMAEHERHKRQAAGVGGHGACAGRGAPHRAGLPRRSPVALSAARDDVHRGVSLRQAAKKRGVPQSTLRDFLRRSGQPTPVRRPLP